MNIPKLSKFFLSAFIVSELMIGASLIFFKIKADSLPKIVSKDLILNQKKFSQQEINLVTYQQNNLFYFYKDYFQFLILEDLSLQHSAFLKEKVKFYYDNLLKPRSVKVVMGKNNEET
jgi:hypothetical protein